MVHVNSPKLAILVLKNGFYFFLIEKKFAKNHKTEVLNILETRLVSKFGVIRLKITLFSKEKRYF